MDLGAFIDHSAFGPYKYRAMLSLAPKPGRVTEPGDQFEERWRVHSECS
jgi:hypothetical protein